MSRRHSVTRVTLITPAVGGPPATECQDTVGSAYRVGEA